MTEQEKLEEKRTELINDDLRDFAVSIITQTRCVILRIDLKPEYHFRGIRLVRFSDLVILSTSEAVLALE